MSRASDKLLEIYHALFEHYGPQGWWPADSPTETIIGCILVQHARWDKVAESISRLEAENLLSFREMLTTDQAHLANLIRPAGMPKVKAGRLLAFATHLGDRYEFDLELMLASSADALREELLSIKGIGPETADCIVLYAANQASFVADTYARRVMTRHLLSSADWRYEQLKDFFESNLSADVALFNEYHALLVAVGKNHCRKKPKCDGCPLEYLEHQTEGRDC